MLLGQDLRVKKLSRGAGEMIRWLGALDALLEDPHLIPSTHMVALNCL